jgi:hypothetical protein
MAHGIAHAVVPAGHAPAPMHEFTRRGSDGRPMLRPDGRPCRAFWCSVDSVQLDEDEIRDLCRKLDIAPEPIFGDVLT